MGKETGMPNAEDFRTNKSIDDSDFQLPAPEVFDRPIDPKNRKLDEHIKKKFRDMQIEDEGRFNMSGLKARKKLFSKMLLIIEKAKRDKKSIYIKNTTSLKDPSVLDQMDAVLEGISPFLADDVKKTALTLRVENIFRTEDKNIKQQIVEAFCDYSNVIKSNLLGLRGKGASGSKEIHPPR